uniref:RNA-binding protein n=1 Tax=Caudovirales sp. ctNZz8 TaxID=2826772 RepID=A0A8S5QZC4_9CAUD|nr:MAG TPA: RNA-binding protein [Caudovirales sp. ctNZz8]
MAYYWTCPNCGSNNDPGERCDCHGEEKREVAPLHRERPRANAYPQLVYQPLCAKSSGEEVLPWQKS